MRMCTSHGEYKGRHGISGHGPETCAACVNRSRVEAGAPTLEKAMTNIQDPMFDPPKRPVRKYYNHTDGTVTT